MSQISNTSNYEKIKAKLIFNPKAGATRKIRIELSDIIHEMKTWNIEPDICVLDPGCNLAVELRTALAHGISLFIVCGGDGTISSVSNILAGTKAKLAIIPCGTQNNNAKSLNIPLNLYDSVALIRSGNLIMVDMGILACGKVLRHFMEIVSIGLVAELSESGDEIQHGGISSLGEFISTLVTCPPSQINLTLDNKLKIQETGFVVVVTNMPYAGFHYQFGEAGCYKDGLLNVLFFSNLSKLDLIKYISQGIYLEKPEDPRIQHYLVRELDIETDPPMSIAVDGNVIEYEKEGKVHISLKRKALGVITGTG